MHRIHTTEAFVLGSSSQGEGSSFARLYTRELGLVSGWVQGTRMLKSKLRAHVQPFSHSTLSFVRGRDMWRVVGAEGIERIVNPLESPEQFRFVSKIFVLLSRLVAGEEADPHLFDIVREGIYAGTALRCDADLSSLELLLVLQVVAHLGYLPEDERISPFLAFRPSDTRAYDELRSHRSHAVALVNSALQASQL